MSSTVTELPVADQAAIRSVLDGVYAAWAANDADRFVADYAEAATAQLPGSYLADREAVRACMEAVFAGPLRGTRAVHEVRAIRLVTPDLAIVISRAAVVMPGQAEPAPETASLDTWVLSRQDGAWRVEAFHGSPEQAG
jgi:uncharacterized protein (TIGR02246 family)